jgi:hypothetical protein
MKLNRLIAVSIVGFSLLTTTTSAFACDHDSHSWSFFGWCSHDDKDKDHKDCDHDRNSGGHDCNHGGSSSGSGSSTGSGGSSTGSGSTGSGSGSGSSGNCGPKGCN